MRTDARWWTAEPARLAGRVCETLDRFERQDQDRLAELLTHARLYGGTKQLGLGPASYSTNLPGERLKRNVVASCVDTAVAKLAKNRPAPQFVTNGAAWDTRRRVGKLNKFAKGLLHQTDAYRLGPVKLREACVFGTSLVKIVPRGKVIGLEGAFPWEVFVDALESLYGEPRQLVQRRFVDRAVALEAFVGEGRGVGERRAAIELAPTPDDQANAMGRDATCDQIEVVEAWRLPSSDEADDGRHVIVTRRGVLLDEKWTRQSFPFVVMRWEDPLVGFWGRGMADRLKGIQFELNKLLQRIQLAMHTFSATKVYLDEASGIPKAHVDNVTGTVHMVSRGGTPPVIVPQQAVHPEMFAQIDRLVAAAYEEVGISQLAATSRKPAGLDSGAALREFNDIESERFVIAGRRWEEWHLDIVRRALDEVREMPGFTIDAPDRREPETLEWADVNLAESAYTLQCFPVSLLPQTPAGRIQMVQELASAGWIDPGTGMEMLDLPDLEEMWSRVTASRRHVRSVLNSLLDGGEREAPDGSIDLRVALELSSAAVWEAEDNGAPEDVVESVRQYRDAVASLMAKAAAPPPAAAPPMPAEAMGPQAAPAGPPVPAPMAA
jgi:hypothetical protein